MDRRVAAARTDAPPELWPLALATLTFIALVWTGTIESILRGTTDPLHPRRLAIALWGAAGLWILAAWRHLGTRS